MSEGRPPSQPDSDVFGDHSLAIRQALVETSERLVDAADMILRSTPPVSSLWEDVLLGFAGKSLKTYRAIMLLCLHGYGEDASILLRSLMESAVHLSYISADPENRSRLFAEYDHILRKRFLDDALRMGLIPEDRVKEERREILASYREVERNYPDKLSWSGKSIKEMARESDLLWHYGVVYRLSSDFVHASPSGIDHYLRQEGPLREVASGPGEAWINESLAAGSEMLLHVLFVYDRALELGFSPQLDEILESLPRSKAAD